MAVRKITHIPASEILAGDHIHVAERTFVIELIRPQLNLAGNPFLILYMESLDAPKVLIALTVAGEDKLSVLREV